MSRNKCKKNKINIINAIEIFKDGYGLKVKQMNFYQFRISSEEFKNIFYDWYHTTGSLVKNKDGYNSKVLKKFLEPEELAIFIQDQFYV